MRSTQCDIVFMDISMPGKNGLELLKLAPNLKSEIIFITAHSEYALNAFKVSASGYIMKPIDDADIVIAVDHAMERIKYKKMAKEKPDIGPKPKIGIPNYNGIDYVAMDDILYFESVNKCTNVVLKDKEIISSYHIGRFKVLTEGHFFYRVHRSYIVNLNCIVRYESSGILIMSNKREIPISKSEKDDFLKIFDIVSRIENMDEEENQ